MHIPENIVVSLVGFIALVLIALHYALKVYENWFKIFKPKDNKAAFMADCYKLQQKYAKRGETEYCDALSMVIRAYNLPPEKDKAKTFNGLKVQEALEEE